MLLRLSLPTPHTAPGPSIGLGTRGRKCGGVMRGNSSDAHPLGELSQEPPRQAKTSGPLSAVGS
jgi:hypothetical protein